MARDANGKALKKHLNFDSTHSSNNLVEVYINSHGTPSTRCPSSCHHQSRENIPWHQIRGNCSHESSLMVSSAKKHSPGLRRTNAEKSLQNKKRVIQMLFVVVLEFFICWTPLYVINTIALFNPQIVYQTIGYSTITYFQLLAYTSSCCNPITYCFMNRGFRKAFLNLFRCFKRFHEPRRMSIGGVGVGGAPSAAVIVGNGATQFSKSEVHRFQTQRTKPVDCGTELNVLNYMHSVNPTTPTSFRNQITMALVDSNNHNQINSAS